MKNPGIALVLLLSLAGAGSAQALDGGIESLRQTGKAFAAVAKEASPSVVYIQVEGKPSSPVMGRFVPPFGEEWPFGGEWLRRFFGDQLPDKRPFRHPSKPEAEQRTVAQGSGFVLAPKGGAVPGKAYILTNSHMVEDADRIRVKLADGREFDAKVTGRDPQSDVAVIEIAADGVPPLPLGDSSKLEVGEWVVAIGNPFGLSHTLTVGVVSATGRTSLGINDYEDFIQTDAAINPGNSGGPLVNLDGKAVGMNTAIFSRSGGYMGVGFAIPINLAASIANQLIEHGVVTRGYLGVMIQTLTPDLAASFGIAPNAGILIAQVQPNSPAARAGLHQGDVIVAFRGQPVGAIGRFRNEVSLTPPGSRQQLVVLRNGQRKTIDITIGTLTKDKMIAQGEAPGPDILGLSVQTLTQELAEQFGATLGQGVVVTQVKAGSVAAMAGIETGTVILQANQQPVATAADFRRVVSASSHQRRLLLLVRKDKVQRYIALRW